MFVSSKFFSKVHLYTKCAVKVCSCNWKFLHISWLILYFNLITLLSTCFVSWKYGHLYSLCIIYSQCQSFLCPKICWRRTSLEELTGYSTPADFFDWWRGACNPPFQEFHPRFWPLASIIIRALIFVQFKIYFIKKTWFRTDICAIKPWFEAMLVCRHKDAAARLILVSS